MKDLAKYGLAGVSIALCLIVYVCVDKVFTLSGNHIDHNTAAIDRQTEVLTDLKSSIDNNNRVLERLIDNINCQ